MAVIPEHLWDEDALAWVVGERGGLYVAVKPFLFTCGIILGRLTFVDYYQDRWCYHSDDAAYAAAVAWLESTDPEPRGWHRHPASGRRVDDDGTRSIRY